MTKKELFELITDYPDDSQVGLMYNGGDSCGLELMEFFDKEGKKDTQHVILEPSRPSSIDNEPNIQALDNLLNKLTNIK